MSDIKSIIKTRVSERIDYTADLRDEDITHIIDECIFEENKKVRIPLSEKLQIRTEIFNSLRRLDVLSELLDDDDISEIMVNGFDRIFIEKKGELLKTDKRFESPEKLASVIQHIVADCNRRINESSPIVDARLRDGSRVNIVLEPVSLTGNTVTIRRFPRHVIDMQELIRIGSISEDAAYFLRQLVRSRYNIFVSGGTGSGKTTFLNALSAYIPTSERIITIEDSAELQLKWINNLVRLEARNSNIEGENSICIRDLIKSSLRMRPDRIIVGEVRDSAAIDMLAAMNTGHDGSLSTGHANSAYDMLSRLETMVLMGMDIPLQAVKSQIASAIDIIIHLGRVRDRTRKVLSISEVNGMKDGEIVLNTLYQFEEEISELERVNGKLRKVNDMLNVEKLLSSGFSITKEGCVVELSKIYPLKSEEYELSCI